MNAAVIVLARLQAALLHALVRCESDCVRSVYTGISVAVNVSRRNLVGHDRSRQRRKRRVWNGAICISIAESNGTALRHQPLCSDVVRVLIFPVEGNAVHERCGACDGIDDCVRASCRSSK
jgi:hypothetical protein